MIENIVSSAKIYCNKDEKIKADHIIHNKEQESATTSGRWSRTGVQYDFHQLAITSAMCRPWQTDSTQFQRQRSGFQRSVQYNKANGFSG